jgi:hypothetical protein
MYDAFISHASEDKNDFVRKLAKKLADNNLAIWYDEFSLKLGDSLRSSIDYGLKNSKYGIVVFSPNFFNKKWTEWELNGLVQLQMKSKRSRILPIWHNIDKEQILAFSPSLADIVSINSSLGTDFVAKKIIEVIKPKGSSIKFAWNYLNDLGYNPPEISDEWWYEIIEYDGSDANAFDWAFPIIGTHSDDPKKKGIYFAEKAIQKKWQEVVQEENISQLTSPDRLHKIINSIPGLNNILLDSLHYTIRYAPQITIKGFGGFFESPIEEYYHKSLTENLPKENLPKSAELAIEKKSPICDEDIALRDPNFGFHEASRITCQFVQGELMGVAYPRVFEYFDYLIGLISKDTDWMPPKIKSYLLSGFHDWNVWSWYKVPSRYSRVIKKTKNTGNLYNLMIDAVEKEKSFKITKTVIGDIKDRITWSKNILELNDEVDNLYNCFMEYGFIDSFIQDRIKRKYRQ